MTADVFPGRSALAALGGADDVWLNGYRRGWELADNPRDADRERIRHVRISFDTWSPILQKMWDGLLAGWNDNNGGEFR